VETSKERKRKVRSSIRFSHERARDESRNANVIEAKGCECGQINHTAKSIISTVEADFDSAHP
jgi:hypothetical protein